MDKKARIEEVEKYIDKYFIPGNADINIDDKEVKSFFDKITQFRKKKKEQPVEPEEVCSSAVLEEECAKPEFDISTAKKTKVIQPLSKTISTSRKIEDLMNQMDETFSQRLLRMIQERNMSESDAYKKAYVDRRQFSKIKKDVYYTPNKKTVLAFAIALELTLDETMDLLRSAGYALSRSSKFDIIIAYFLENNVYDMFEINEVLYEYEQPIFE